MTRRDDLPTEIQISEAELTVMTRELDDIHNDSMSQVRENMAGVADRIASVTRTVANRRTFLLGGCWFFTVNLLDRRCRLLTEHTRCAKRRGSLRRATHLRSTPWWCCPIIFTRFGHCRPTMPFSLRWRLIKIAFAQAIPASCASSSESNRSRTPEVQMSLLPWMMVPPPA